MSFRSWWAPVVDLEDGTRRRLRAVLLTLVAAAALSAPVLAAGGTAFAAPTCDTWVGGSGTWNETDGSNWSTGVPTPSTNVCITNSGTYTVTAVDLLNANSITLGGSSGKQTLVVVGNSTVESELTIVSASVIEANGILEVSSTGNGSSYIRDNTITNKGTFEAIGSGSVTPDQIYTGITNEKGATVDIDDDSELPLNGSIVTNNGTFKIAKGATMALDGPDTFTQNGTLDVAGTFQTLTGDVFNEKGGTATGHPVDVANTTFNDSGGRGTFDLEGAGTALSGTVPPGQTLNVLGIPNDAETTIVGSHVVNHGTIVLTSKAGNFAEIGGTTLLNASQLDIEGAGQDQLHANVTNEAGGTVDLTTPSPTQIGGAFTNEGKLVLGLGAEATLNGGSVSLRHGSTTDVTIAAKGRAPQITGAGTLSVGGTLDVTTVGSVKAGRHFAIVSAATPKGHFSSLDFPRASYGITYSSTAITLTAAAPLHARSVAVSATKGKTSSFTVADLSDVPAGAIIHSTINWGDGTTAAGRVGIHGHKGSVSAAHRYTKVGSFTVTVTVDWDGHVVTVKGSATVTS